MRLKTTNNAGTTLAASLDNIGTTATVTNGSLFPEVPFRCTIHKGDPAQGEIIEVGEKIGNTFSSILRGLEGTSATAWDIGDKVDLLITSGVLKDLNQLIDERDSKTYNYAFKINSEGVFTLVLEEDI